MPAPNKTVNFDQDGEFADEPLVVESVKALRHKLQEEFRVMPLHERIARILALAVTDPDEADTSTRQLIVQTRMIAAVGNKRHPAQRMYRVCCLAIESAWCPDVDTAVTELGADLLASLDRQVAELREKVDKLDARINIVRGRKR